MGRTGSVERKTKETELRVQVDLDGSGQADVSTGIPFFDHMLETLAKHGALDLALHCKGDLHIDQHHTTEDSGIALGQALDQALGDRRGIARAGHFYFPLDEALADHARCNLHVDLLRGRDFHHGTEAVFKAFARALRQAAALDPRTPGVPSTKGVL